MQDWICRAVFGAIDYLQFNRHDKRYHTGSYEERYVKD